MDLDQERMFQNNQKQFYRKLNEEVEICGNEQLDTAEESQNRPAVLKQCQNVLELISKQTHG